jgi:hypothetical protein
MEWQSNAPNYHSLCDFVEEMQAAVEDTGYEPTQGGHRATCRFSSGTRSFLCAKVAQKKEKILPMVSQN